MVKLDNTDARDQDGFEHQAHASASRRELLVNYLFPSHFPIPLKMELSSPSLAEVRARYNLNLLPG